MAKRTLPKSKRQYVQNFEARRIAATLPARRATRFPSFIAPALATLSSMPPSGERWVHEVKFDGYRLQMHLKEGMARFFTRRGHDWTDRFKPLAVAAWSLPTNGAVLDGELVVQSPDGTTDFGALEKDLAGGHSDRFRYFIFDVLYLDGYDLRAVPLIQRKQVLAALLEGAKLPLLLSEHFKADGNELYKRACELGLEGLVSKRVDGRYQSGRTANWTKVTCRNRESFYAIGIATKQGKFDGVYLGRKDGDELLYAGKVEHGFDDWQVRELKARLEPHKTRTQPLTKKVNKSKATWYKPSVLVDVEYRALTGARKLRHPSYKGLREDLGET